jgi:thiamine kinase-like enzyme
MKSQNISLVNFDNMSANLSGIFNRLLKAKFGEQVVDIGEIPGGINSEAYKICTDRGNEYFGKFYRRRKGDSRNRLATEFGAIVFLWQKGIKNIPEPLLASEEDGLAIYRFIKGSKIKPGEITKSDIDEAADFAIQVHSFTYSEGAGNQPIASEACFSIKEYIDCVDGRVSKLKQVIKEGFIFNSLSTYLEDEFMPFFNIIKKEAERKAKNLGMDMDEKLHKSKRTLSVSDFGFHNAIRSDSGKLFFFDFEYYGWDDPVKMIADFYLQLAVQVPAEYRVYFFKKVRGNYQEGIELEKRLSMIYPILGLKWCLIILNIFSRVDDGEAKEEILFEYLNKSIRKFKEIKNEVKIGAFPIILA